MSVSGSVLVKQGVRETHQIPARDIKKELGTVVVRRPSTSRTSEVACQQRNLV